MNNSQLAGDLTSPRRPDSLFKTIYTFLFREREATTAPRHRTATHSAGRTKPATPQRGATRTGPQGGHDGARGLWLRFEKRYDSQGFLQGLPFRPEHLYVSFATLIERVVPLYHTDRLARFD